MADKINAQIMVNVTGEDIDDIMSTALDFIGYWAVYARPDGEYLGEYASEQISRGGRLFIKEEDGDKYVLDKEKFLKGLEMYEPSIERGELVYDSRSMKFSLDTGMIDGEAADSIIQYALFGEIVYG